MFLGVGVSYEILRYIRDVEIKEAILSIKIHQETTFISLSNLYLLLYINFIMK